VAELTLDDGGRIVLRPVTPEDKELLLQGFARLSDASRYHRFLGPKPRLTPDDLERFTHVDHHDHEAIGAIDAASGRGVGIARYIRLEPGGDVAEAAVAVIDEWQGRGVGRALVRRLAQRAREEGVHHFCATVLTDNYGMLALLEQLGRVEVLEREHRRVVVEVTLPVEEGRLREALRATARGDVVGGGT
jgi:RimJ/RimL family protein N-acetyltransferase